MKTQKWKKALSLLLAFAMIFVLALPVANAAGEEKTETVTLHKLLLANKTKLDAWNANAIEDAFSNWTKKDNGDVVNGEGQKMYKTGDGKYTTDSTGNTALTEVPKGYDASQNMTQFNEILKGLGTDLPTEIEGAYFAWQLPDHPTVTEADLAAGGIFSTVTPKPETGDPVYIKGSDSKDIPGTDLLAPSTKTVSGVIQVELTADINQAMGGITKDLGTGEKGIKFDTKNLPAGKYLINEIHNKSTYVGPDGKTLTEVKAVPVALTMPIVNKSGVVKDAHVYPKNIEDKPDTTKTIEEKEKIIKDKKYNGKDVYGYGVGDKVPYTITATIPAQAKYETAYWTDQMTEGLTFLNDKDNPVVVKLGTLNLENADYEITPYGNGFKLSLTSSGLKKINNQSETKTLTISYKALMNSAAVTAIAATPGEPEANDVSFHYGNNPDHGNTPVPNKPNEGEMEIAKSWVDGEGAPLQNPPAGVTATFTIYDAQTGEPVMKGSTPYSITVDGQPGGDEPSAWHAKFTGLDNDREYIIKETYITGYSAEYATDGLGKMTVKNWKDNNPKPIDPEEPRVENFGKKFVKTGKEKGRLAGAQFVVYKKVNGKDLYMVRKSEGKTDELKQALVNAKEKLDAAITAYNNRASNATDEEVKNLLTNVNNAQKAYNTAFVNAKTGYDWVTDKNQATVLFSDGDGKFEVTGLAPGTYYLEETVPPKGYAKLNGPIEFTVNETSYFSGGTINYEKNSENKDAQEVPNKEVTIPQTGGIGTVIFTVVGIAMVAGAFIILRKNREDQYA